MIPLPSPWKWLSPFFQAMYYGHLDKFGGNSPLVLESSELLISEVYAVQTYSPLDSRKRSLPDAQLSRRLGLLLLAQFTSKPNFSALFCVRLLRKGQTRTSRPERVDAAHLGACEPLRPLRSRHECPTTSAIVQMASGDTTFGFTHFSNGNEPADGE